MPFSLNNRCIVIAYHYVQNPRKNFSGIHTCALDEFERQIQFLSRNFRIVSLSEIFKSSQENTGGNLCALTFDDGTKDQFNNAVPILQKYKATATFFVITGTLSGRMPLAHAVHFLLSKMAISALVSHFHSFVRTSFPKDASRYPISTSAYINKDRELANEDIRIANFKDTMVLLDERIRDDFLNFIFREINHIGLSTEELFLNEKEIAQLYEQGFSVGSHAHTHTSFSRLTVAEINNEIQTSKKILKKITGQAPLSFCYPYGHSNRNTMDMFNILQKEGFCHAVTIERRSIQKNDHRFLVPRYITEDIKFFLDSSC